ncbi:hypothetical protein F4X88_17350 [Candidatus Poribacteria bacterium]|nr:hypothetical protein [Candidatus Poribacteria bacterium]MYA58051.1 hypothetical protein [Candidatus Poribacteria bacterium]
MSRKTNHDQNYAVFGFPLILSEGEVRNLANGEGLIRVGIRSPVLRKNERLRLCYNTSFTNTRRYDILKPTAIQTQEVKNHASND